MNRRGVIGSILAVCGIGGARAQSYTPEPVWCAEGSYLHNCTAPKNNQCPVCGTMAEPLVPRQSHLGRLVHCKKPWVMCKIEYDMIEPISPQLTRCKRCNVAFWQDYKQAG